MPGYEIDRFVDLTQNEKNELICSICQDILRCPVVTNCCLQTFCDDCINDWLDNNNTCPYDRKTLTTDQLSRAPRMVMNLLGKLRIRCDFRDNGCNKVILLENLNNHLQQCQYNNDVNECEKCFCTNIRPNHNCVEYLLDTNNKITIELNQLKISNEKLKREKETSLQTIGDLKNEAQCRSEHDLKLVDTTLILIGKLTSNRNSTDLLSLSEALNIISKTNKFESTANEVIKRNVITKTLDILHLKSKEKQVNTNLLQTLLRFKIPEDVEFEYDRVVNSVVQIIDNENVDQTILEMCFCLLTFLTLVKSKRHLIGNEKGMKTILKRIREKVELNADQDIVKSAWTILWNITDENATICELFYKSNGLKCFSACYASFPTNLILIRAMFGVLLNVAECPHLRPHLLDNTYITVLMRHLDWRESDGEMEHCFIAGGIMSYLLLVDTEVWDRKLPTIRVDVQRLLSVAIPRWNVNTGRLINYHNFKPFQQILLSNNYVNLSKYWVIWELANLTSVNASQYCPYLDDSNLVVLVDSVAKSTVCTPNMRLLATTVMRNYKNFKNNN